MSTTTRNIRMPRPNLNFGELQDAIAPDRVSRIVMTASATIALFFLSIAIGLGLYGYAHEDRIYQGVSIAGIEVGGMTEAEARAAVDSRFDAYLAQPVTLTLNDKAFPVVPGASGVELDLDATVDRAFAFGREGSLWERTRSWARGLIRGTSVPAVVAVDDTRLDRSLTAYAPEITRAPSDAYVDVTSSETPTIVPEQDGIAFDLGTTKARLVSHVASLDSAPLPLVAPVIPPSVRSGDLTGQLAEVQSAVSNALLISGVDGVDQFWAISQDDLKRIVSVTKPGEPVQINKSAIQDMVNGIAKSVEHPAVDAQLIVNQNGELQVIPSDRSVEVNVKKTVETIVSALTAGTHNVDLVVKRVQPAISDADAQAALQRAEKIVGDGIRLTFKDEDLKLGRTDLIAALTVTVQPENQDERIAVGLSPEVITQLVGIVAQSIDEAPQNGRYRLVNGSVSLVEKGSNGRQVDIEKSTNAIVRAVLNDQGSAKLTVRSVEPEFTDTAASKIKLKDVLGTAATYYGNSSEARRKNVERAVELQSGWLVAPGDVFSYWQNIGKVDEKNGFVTGLGILADGAGGIKTAPVIGGGICQVSTTIFQAAFWSGLQIVDRTAHPYWLLNYGNPPSGMKGLDAMVNIEDTLEASLDLQFRNNTGNWIAIEMVADGEYVTSRVLGVNPGWSVRVDGDGPTIDNIVEPPTETIRQDSPEIPAGEERVVETAQVGFDATIRRITTDKDGAVIDEYVITSTYVPSVNRVLVGTGQ